jgi:hypothetical protein
VLWAFLGPGHHLFDFMGAHIDQLSNEEKNCHESMGNGSIEKVEGEMSKGNM